VSLNHGDLGGSFTSHFPENQYLRELHRNQQWIIAPSNDYTNKKRPFFKLIDMYIEIAENPTNNGKASDLGAHAGE
jgi:hypothetical protein